MSMTRISWTRTRAQRDGAMKATHVPPPTSDLHVWWDANATRFIQHNQASINVRSSICCRCAAYVVPARELWLPPRSTERGAREGWFWKVDSPRAACVPAGCTQQYFHISAGMCRVSKRGRGLHYSTVYSPGRRGGGRVRKRERFFCRSSVQTKNDGVTAAENTPPYKMREPDRKKKKKKTESILLHSSVLQN